MRVMREPKVASKTRTSWEVRAISGTRIMADLWACKASVASWR